MSGVWGRDKLRQVFPHANAESLPRSRDLVSGDSLRQLLPVTTTPSTQKHKVVPTWIGSGALFSDHPTNRD